MGPYYDRDGITIYHGDSAAIAPSIPGVDAVISDPPYGMAWDTDSTRFSGGVNPDARRDAGRDDWGEVRQDANPFDPSPWMGYPRVVLWAGTTGRRGRRWGPLWSGSSGPTTCSARSCRTPNWPG